MLHLRGCPALSEFRLQKLLQQLQALVPAVTGVSADYLHIAELDGPLDAQQQQVLERLLSYGPVPAAGASEGVTLVVVPRPGTISPWSSKATDIVHNCGLEQVLRVERGIVYTLQLAPGAGLPASAREAL